MKVGMLGETRLTKWCRYISEEVIEEYIQQGWVLSFFRYYGLKNKSFLAILEVSNNAEKEDL